MRWRRSRGFGVHSPFAYEFITDVLNLRGYEYYAYPEIAGFCPRARRAGFNEIFAGRDMSIDEAHLIFRTLCYFNPSRVVEMGSGLEVTNILFKRGVPSARRDHWVVGRKLTIERTDAPLFVLVNRMTDGDFEEARDFLLERVAAGHCVIVVRRLSLFRNQRLLWEAVCGAGVPGMGFTDGHIGIFVARHGLPHSVFEIVL